MGILTIIYVMVLSPGKQMTKFQNKGKLVTYLKGGLKGKYNENVKKYDVFEDVPANKFYSVVLYNAFPVLLNIEPENLDKNDPQMQQIRGVYDKSKKAVHRVLDRRKYKLFMFCSWRKAAGYFLWGNHNIMKSSQ